MIDEICEDAQDRMGKSLESLAAAFAKIRTGRAHPSLLDEITVSYYGVDTPLNQVASVGVEDARTLKVNPYEKPMIVEIEKAILKSNLGLNPSTSGNMIRIPLPMLTEETRKELIKVARNEAEGCRIAIRNIRRDANGDFKDLQKEKEITEDEQHDAEDRVQKLTDKFVATIELRLGEKEKDLMKI